MPRSSLQSIATGINSQSSVCCNGDGSPSWGCAAPRSSSRHSVRGDAGRSQLGSEEMQQQPEASPVREPKDGGKIDGQLELGSVESRPAPRKRRQARMRGISKRRPGFPVGSESRCISKGCGEGAVHGGGEDGGEGGRSSCSVRSSWAMDPWKLVRWSMNCALGALKSSNVAVNVCSKLWWCRRS